QGVMVGRFLGRGSIQAVGANVSHTELPSGSLSPSLPPNPWLPETGNGAATENPAELATETGITAPANRSGKLPPTNPSVSWTTGVGLAAGRGSVTGDALGTSSPAWPPPLYRCPIPKSRYHVPPRSPPL